MSLPLTCTLDKIPEEIEQAAETWHEPSRVRSGKGSIVY